MLSKKNIQGRLRKVEPTEQRFSIRKFTVGAASVLIGMAFMGMSNVQTVHADTLPDAQTTAKVKNVSPTIANKLNAAKIEADKSAATEKSAKEKATLSSSANENKAASTNINSTENENNVVETNGTTDTDKGQESVTKASTTKKVTNNKAVENKMGGK